MLPTLLDRLRAAPQRTGAVIVTLYGDSIAPRGGCLSLSDLCAVFGAMGIGEGVVRTSVSRLAADGWLERTRQGRRSFYRLAQRGLEATELAVPLIYGPICSPQGALTLVLGERGGQMAGQGILEPGVWVDHTGTPPEDAITLELGGTPAMLARMASRAWPLDDLAARYGSFLDAVQPPNPGLIGLEALLARLLLVHEYRRVVLRDPRLPRALLPPNWPGFAARDLCHDAYEALRAESEAWLDQAEAETGRLPRPNPGRRFTPSR